MSADRTAASPGIGIGATSIDVEVVYSPAARVVDCMALQLPGGSRLADALRHSALLGRHPELRAAPLAVGVWGRLCEQDQLLRSGDRVEVYRPLQIDPKEARRQRQRRQKVRVVAI